jgi:hypothetical protein
MSFYFLTEFFTYFFKISAQLLKSPCIYESCILVDAIFHLISSCWTIILVQFSSGSMGDYSFVDQATQTCMVQIS